MSVTNTCYTCKFFSGALCLPCAIQPWHFPKGCSDWEFGAPLKNISDYVPTWEVLADLPEEGWAIALDLPLRGEYEHKEVAIDYLDAGWAIAVPVDQPKVLRTFFPSHILNEVIIEHSYGEWFYYYDVYTVRHVPGYTPYMFSRDIEELPNNYLFNGQLFDS